ncbi:MAG: biotin/lipoyl-containing protein [Planctomycetota bacterium]
MPPPAEYNIIVPDVGAGTLRIRVCSWLAELGETVREGDRIVELSLPGMTFDINSPADGLLIAIDKTLGTEVHPGDILGRLQAQEDE